MNDPLTQFIDPDNLCHLAAMRHADYPEYMAEISKWYQRIGSVSGLSVSGLDGVVKAAGPGLIEERTLGKPEVETFASILQKPATDRIEAKV